MATLGLCPLPVCPNMKLMTASQYRSLLRVLFLVQAIFIKTARR